MNKRVSIKEQSGGKRHMDSGNVYLITFSNVYMLSIHSSQDDIRNH